MPQPLLSADLFVKEIAYQVGFTLPGKDPYDTAEALEKLGYIQRANNAFEKTSTGQVLYHCLTSARVGSGNLSTLFSIIRLFP